MDKQGWVHYTASTFNGTEVKASLVFQLITFVLARKIADEIPRLNAFNSEFSGLVTGKELRQLFSAVEQFAENYMHAEQKPQIFSKLWETCMRLCVDDFESALELIRTFDFAKL